MSSLARPDSALQLWSYRLIGNRRFLVNICHSDHTRSKYLDLGIPQDERHFVRNGFEPQRLQAPVPIEITKRQIGIDSDRKAIVHIGRINHKKGLKLVIKAARRLPDYLFILVGSYGEDSMEAIANAVANVRVIPWQPPEALGQYSFPADVLLIPPSWRLLAEFGSAMLPLKLFFYMVSGRPILAGDTPDVREVLKHRVNALLLPPGLPGFAGRGDRRIDRRDGTRRASCRDGAGRQPRFHLELACA